MYMHPCMYIHTFIDICIYVSINQRKSLSNYSVHMVHIAVLISMIMITVLETMTMIIIKTRQIIVIMIANDNTN
jgi:hypothetical protein